MAGANADNGYLAYLDAVRNAIGKVGYDVWFLAMGNSLAVEGLIPEGFWRKGLKFRNISDCSGAKNGTRARRRLPATVTSAVKSRKLARRE